MLQQILATRQAINYARFLYANRGRVSTAEVLGGAFVAGLWVATASIYVWTAMQTWHYFNLGQADKELTAAGNSVDLNESKTHLDNAQALIDKYDGYHKHTDLAIDALERKIDGFIAGGIEPGTDKYSAASTTISESVTNNLKPQVADEIDSASNMVGWGAVGSIISTLFSSVISYAYKQRVRELRENRRRNRRNLNAEAAGGGN